MSGILYGNGMNDLFSEGKTAPILKSPHKSLLPTIVNDLRGNNRHATEFLHRSKIQLDKRLPRVVEVAKEIYRKRINGMIDPKDLSVFPVWARNMPDCPPAVPALFVGRTDLDSYEIIPVIGELFSPEEAAEVERIIDHDPFYFIAASKE